MAFVFLGAAGTISTGAAALGSASLAIGSSVMQSNAANKQARQAQENASRRYAMQGATAQMQMDEQQSLAFEKMTEVTRQFLVSKGTMQAAQAETMVGGNVQKRLEAQRRTTESETKGQIAKQANANIVNIAQGMLAQKIDTDAITAELQARKKSTLTIAAEAGIYGLQSGASALSGIKDMNPSAKMPWS